MARPVGGGENQTVLCAVLTDSRGKPSVIGITWFWPRWWAVISLCPWMSSPTGQGTANTPPGSVFLRRVRAHLGARFIDYVVVDGGFAAAPFLHLATEAGWPVVARLKENLPDRKPLLKDPPQPNIRNCCEIVNLVQSRGRRW
jgi:hypothetical protein